MCSPQAVQVTREHGIGNYWWRWEAWQRIFQLGWPRKENLWYHRKLPSLWEASMVRRFQAKSLCLQPSAPKKSEGKTVQQVNGGGQRILSMTPICGLFPQKSFLSSVSLTSHRAHSLHLRSALAGAGRWPNDWNKKESSTEASCYVWVVTRSLFHLFSLDKRACNLPDRLK